MQKIHTTEIYGILILALAILGSGGISAAQADDLCGNALCEATESCITCGVDCSCGNDFEWNCADAVDNDLDESTDCKDPDCTEDLACVIVSDIKALPIKNSPPLLAEQGSKSAAPDEYVDLTTATQHIAARVPPWIFPAVLAFSLSMLLIHSRMRLMHFEDQDEW